MNPDLPDTQPDTGEPRALVPNKGSKGEWHDIPMGEPHSSQDCPCNPQLRVTKNDAEQLRAVWVHNTHSATTD